MKRILYFLLGLIGFVSLLCSIAASCVTNENLMKQGFIQYSQTAHMNVPASEYEKYAKLICRYLDGRQDFIMSMDPDTYETDPIFSDKESLHLADVKGLVTALKIIRWTGGGIVLAVLLVLYLKSAENRELFLSEAVRGFALSALFLLLIAAILAVWGALNFRGLFWTFHQIAFSNDLWLLDPSTDLLVALMPLPFFTWYAGEMLKSMLPVLGVMLLVIIAWLKTRKTQKETETK